MRHLAKLEHAPPNPRRPSRPSSVPASAERLGSIAEAQTRRRPSPWLYISRFDIAAERACQSLDLWVDQPTEARGVTGQNESVQSVMQQQCCVLQVFSVPPVQRQGRLRREHQAINRQAGSDGIANMRPAPLLISIACNSREPDPPALTLVSRSCVFGVSTRVAPTTSNILLLKITHSALAICYRCQSSQLTVVP